MHDSGDYSITDLTELFSIGRATVYRTLQREQLSQGLMSSARGYFAPRVSFGKRMAVRRREPSTVPPLPALGTETTTRWRTRPAHHRSTDPQDFLTEDDDGRHLHRCLNDQDVPLDVRVAGAFVLVFGLHVARIVELTTDDLDLRDEPHSCASTATTSSCHRPSQPCSPNTSRPPRPRPWPAGRAHQRTGCSPGN